ncbi:MAG: aminotransferase class I/II-fold pyridoxal phosphate-dependent enzyme [Pseudomonadota bacterium]
MTANDPARLELTPDEMRALGYRAVDMVVEHWTSLAQKPAAVHVELEDLRPTLREPLPETAGDWRDALDFARDNVFETMGQIAHPRFLAFVPGPSNFVGAMADIMTSGYNTAASLWRETPGPAELELTTLEWLKALCGFDDACEGIFTSGGSVANLTGLAAAREAKLGEDTDDAVAYCASQTHSSVARGFRILGFRRDQLRPIAIDDRFRIDMAALKAAIDNDIAAGRRPFCIVGNAGTTNTGAIDPLETMADLAAQHDLWLHVDGAYGGAASLVPQGRALLAGMERADSVVIDPHKWLFQPYEAGVVFVRHPGLLDRTFASSPEYLQDVAAGEQEVNFSERSIQLSRGLRAFKLWLSLKVFGAEAFRAAVQRGIEIAERAEAMLKESGRFEIVTPATIGVVTFRFLRDGLDDPVLDRVHRRIVDALLEDGYAFVTSTELGGRTCLRFCTINPRTTDEDLAGTIERIIRFGDDVNV